LYRYVADARFARILNAVGVFIIPNKITQRSGLEIAGIPGIVGLAGSQDCIHRHACHDAGITVEVRVAAQVGRGRGISGGFGEGQFVGARFEAGECVFTVRAGRRGLIDRGTVAGGAGQHDRHVWNTRFAYILRTVAVEVIPNEIADGCRFEEASIPGQVGFAAFQHGVYGHAGRLVGVAVECIVGTLIGSRCAVSRWFREGYFICTWFQVREQVETACVGGRILHHDIAVAGGAIELHGYAWNTRFARILNAVAVEVVPCVVAECGRLVQACIHGAVVVAAHERIVAAHVGCFADVAVFCVVAAQIGGRNGVSGRRGNGDFISTRFEVAEQVEAVRVGGRGQVDGSSVARSARELNVYIRDARFAGVLYTVAVFVVPNEVAQFGRHEEASIPGPVVFTGNQDRIDGHQGDRIGVAVGRVVAALIIEGDGITCWF